MLRILAIAIISIVVWEVGKWVWFYVSQMWYM